jgi:hypothetical protein
VSFWLTFIACSSPQNHTARVAASREQATAAEPAQTAQPESPTAEPVSRFRLGTAARPFGWSTVIGDFNTDGTPDMAVADRTSGRDDGYAYLLQFTVSGLEPRSVAFQSTYDAVTVRVADVDHDNDLDVVVSAVPSRNIVGIWLNDGRGRFRAADVGTYASSVTMLGAVAIADPSFDTSIAGMVPRRVEDSPPVLVEASPARRREAFGSIRPESIHLPLRSAAIAPRGPPRHLA